MNDDEKTAHRTRQQKRFPLSRNRRRSVQDGEDGRQIESLVGGNPFTGEELAEAAQTAFLERNLHEAMLLAGKSARILPTQSIFALLASIAEGLGDFSKASDFRLLQAFLANDVSLWEELLHEFVQGKLFFRAAVCLRRLIALEVKDKHRYRSLVLQLADLYLGLGETRRCIALLQPMWKASRYRDFEVFAILSSVFFQLGRWNALDRLIRSSLDGCSAQAERLSKYNGGPTGADEGNKRSNALLLSEQELSELLSSTQTRKKRRDRRDIFFGADDDDDDDDNNDDHEERGDAGSSAAPFTSLGDELEQNNEFSFDFESTAHREVLNDQDNAAASTSSFISKVVAAGKFMCSATTDAAKGKKNFLTLINVMLELMVERGQFTEALQLANECSSVVNCALMELPPDILLRVGVAYAHLGIDDAVADCFNELLCTAPFEEYGDAIFDAAECLVRIASYEQAAKMFSALCRYYSLQHGDLQREVDSAVDMTHRAALAKDLRNLSTAWAACLHRLAKCQTQLGLTTDAIVAYEEALSLEPGNAAAMVDLAELQHAMGNSESALTTLRRARLQASSAVPMATSSPTAPPPDPVKSIVCDASMTLLLADMMQRAAAQHPWIVEGRPSGSSGICAGAGSCSSLPRATSIANAVGLAQELLSVGVPLMERTVLQAGDDGDVMSVATGTTGSRRSGARRFVPRMTRAASSIVSSSSIADAMYPASMHSRVSSAVGSIATTFRTGSLSTARVLLARHGAMTVSQVGRSAAHTVGGGHDQKGPAAKDASMIFRFNRTRGKQRLVLAQGAAKRGQEMSGGANWDTGSIGRVDDLVDDVNSSAFGEDGLALATDPSEVVQSNTKRNEDAVGEIGAVRVRKRVRFDGDEESPVVTPDDETKAPTEFSIPDLESVAAANFGADTAMSALFVKITSAITDAKQSSTDTASGEGIVGDLASAAAFESSAVNPTASESLELVGREKMIRVAACIIDAYVVLELFTEAKQFGVTASTAFTRLLHRQQAGTLVAPLRLSSLRLSLASNDVSNATRITSRLLKDATSNSSDVWNCLAQLVNTNDRTKILLRLLVDRGESAETPLLCIVGNQYYRTGSHRHALNLYLIALQRHPHDPFLHFMTGLCYLFLTAQAVGSRDTVVHAALHHLEQYKLLSSAADGRLLGEAMYNIARALQQVSLDYLAAPIYKKIAGLEGVAGALHVPSQCSEAVRNAARVNLYWLYERVSGHHALALAALPDASELVI
jgi:tetratricopeptide (TPR) repeat protein